uniref:Uncharacterized protein n=1 Tax=Oryza meridionalis TaxID=40149 RepID=A0A0E0CJ65_9ORYZ
MDSEPELKAPPPPPLLALLQPQADSVARPWNLRQLTQRRTAASMSWAAAVPVLSSSRHRKHAPFLVTLTPEEIEEDIYAPTSPSLPVSIYIQVSHTENYNPKYGLPLFGVFIMKNLI